MFYTLFDGVCFVEEMPPKARQIRPIDVKIGQGFTHSQLKNLDDIKQIMAEEAKRERGNAIIGFKYGQKSVGFWASFRSLDDVVWHGSGIIATVTASDLI